MSNQPIGDDRRPTVSKPRPTVTFADSFDSHGLDSEDDLSKGAFSDINGITRSRNSTTPTRRNGSLEHQAPSSLLDDEDPSKVVRRSTGHFGPTTMMSRPALSSPYAWHPT